MEVLEHRMTYLGLDIGSVSIKGVIIDKDNFIIKKYYTKNHGLIETIKEVIKKLEVEDRIDGVGITGSGREFVRILIGGDLCESEVISHYVATNTLYPDVKTIIDIGGEDCKLMKIEDGNLVFFNMNHDCGGGTGAMIESIATRMGINLEDIGDIALSSKTKVNIPSKCGVFAQSSVVSKLNKGVRKEDILMGVCRGLIGNYFNMLAKGVNIEGPIVFQGATAKNKALIQCIEDELKTKIIIPEDPEFMGALGVAILTKEEIKSSKFKGFNIGSLDFITETVYGSKCSNECEITKIYQNNNLIGIIGNRCQRCL